MHFETYRWEDHVPRKGGRKFNLIVGALALGLIGAAFPEGDASSLTSAGAKPPATKPAADVRLSGLETPRRILPAAFVGAALPCAIEHAGS